MEQNVEPPVKACLHDAARALQTLRSQGQGMEPRSDAGRRDGRIGRRLHVVVAGAARRPGRSRTAATRSRAQSSRLSCAAVNGAQTSLDPKQLARVDSQRDLWRPRLRLRREGTQPAGRVRTADRQSRESHAVDQGVFADRAGDSSDDPPIYLDYPNQKTPPAAGQREARSDALGDVRRASWPKSSRPPASKPCCRYPGHQDEKYGSINKFLIVKLKAE